LNRKFALLLLAAIPAVLMPLEASGQVAPDAETVPVVSQPALKYEVMVGYDYTSLNQVNTSRHGLQGVKVGAARNFGKYFALAVNGDYFKFEFPGVEPSNPGNPSVYSVLAGPEVRANLYGRLGVFVHGLIGVEYTGGEQMNPDTSFAGGPGMGITWDLNRKLYIFLSGDKIYGSFSFINPDPGSSAHLTSNARGSVGVGYRF
jgi:hypothetical protein